MARKIGGYLFASKRDINAKLRNWAKALVGQRLSVKMPASFSVSDKR